MIVVEDIETHDQLGELQSLDNSTTLSAPAGPDFQGITNYMTYRMMKKTILMVAKNL
jgi:hypothetical protein